MAIRAGAINYDTRPLFLDRVKRLVGRFGEIVGAVPMILPRTRSPIPSIDPRATETESGAAEVAMARQNSVRICGYLGVTFVVLTFGFAALSPWTGRLKPEMAALAQLALLINAYFAAQALFIFATPRYGACVEVALAAFIAILGYAAARTIGGPMVVRLYVYLRKVLRILSRS